MAKTRKPTKKKPDQINRHLIAEMELTMDDWNDLERGVNLFNAGNYWHAHEAWEDVWNRHEDDERLFFQGIIQLAAAFHHVIVRKSYRGTLNNLEHAKEKLEVFGPSYLGIELQPILEAIREIKDELEDAGNEEFTSFTPRSLPKIEFHKPRNPDLTVELGVILESEEFFEGVNLFNDGYYWEARETWETLWREQTGDAKNLLQAFIQMATAYSFIKLSRPDSAKYLFEKTLEKLRIYEENIPTINIGSLVGSMREALQFIQEHNFQRCSLPSELKPFVEISETR